MQSLHTLPGTVIPLGQGEDAEKTLDRLFAAGGLVLSQVTSACNLEGYMVQNWVRRGFCPPPQRKRYTKSQFCRLITINLLKDSLTIAQITALISYINGALDDESDDLIDDALLYVYFTRTLERCALRTPEDARGAAGEVVCDFPEKLPGTRGRLVEVLCVMVLAYTSSEFKKLAAMLTEALPQTPAVN